MNEKSDGRTDDRNEEEGRRQAPPEADSTLPFASSSEAEIPQIGPYRVICRMSRGGQADVYLAFDATVKREVVVKLGRKPVAKGLAKHDQLVHEARLLARLEHPHLVPLYTFGFHQQRPYLVLPHVRGRNLDDVARTKRLDPCQAALLVARLGHALAAAHSLGILHRDVKPANVLIDEAGLPRLIDFGIGLLRREAGDGPLPADAICGTPEWMAPEQTRGESVDQRSDIFGLGAVLYFLLVHKAPFEADSPGSAHRRARECDFDRSAFRAAHVPRRLEKICLRAMEAERDNRYRTVSEFADALHRFCRLRTLLRRSLLVAAPLLLGVAVLIALWSGLGRRHAEVGPPAADFKVRVFRGDNEYGLDHAVPLRTGDRLQIEYELPKDYLSLLFWLDSEGKLTELKPGDAVKSRSSVRRTSPTSDEAYPLQGPPGTELILLCADRSTQPTVAQITALTSEGFPWPKIADVSMIQWGQDETRFAGPYQSGPLRSPGEPAPVQRAALDRTEALRQALSAQFEIVRGVAFPHVDKR